MRAVGVPVFEQFVEGAYLLDEPAARADGENEKSG